MDDRMDNQIVDIQSLEKAVAILDRRYKINVEQRLQHPNQPEKWIKSEVDLDEEINKFRSVATLPEIYDFLVSSGGFDILLSLLTHENTDIAILVLSILAEIIDPETVDQLPSESTFVSSLISSKLPELTIELLYKIDENAGEDDYNAVTNAMEMIEHLIEIDPELTNRFLLCDLSDYLIKRSSIHRTDGMDTNRIYSLELLAICLQTSNDFRNRFGNVNNLDKLLKLVSQFRKSDPDSVEESEIMENAFQCLCNLMLCPPVQQLFGSTKGLNLIIRILHERKKAYRPAIALLDYCLLNSSENCDLFVTKLGLKSLFAIFMRRGVVTKPNTPQELEEDEHVIGIVHSLCSYCTGGQIARVLNKFIEHRYEKLERLVELHDKYIISCKKETKSSQFKNIVYENINMDIEEGNYLESLEHGRSICQLADIIIVRLYNMGNATVSSCILLFLHNKGIKIQDIYQNIMDYIDHLSPNANDERKQLNILLKTFLNGAYNCNLFTD